MFTVNWRHIILDKTTVFGKRVAQAIPDPSKLKPYTSGFLPVNATSWAPGNFSKDQDPGSPANSTNPAAPPSIQKDGLTYRFVFWSCPPGDAITGTFSMDINPTLAVPSNSGTLDATAWYMWDLGGGHGPNALYLDAFDLNTNWFIADDFADVTEVPQELVSGTDKKLTQDANNGSIDTEHLPPDAVDVTAKDPINKWTYYLTLDSWKFASPFTPSSVYDTQSFKVSPGDNGYAFAYYFETQIVRPPVSFTSPLPQLYYNFWVPLLQGREVNIVTGEIRQAWPVPPGPYPIDRLGAKARLISLVSAGLAAGVGIFVGAFAGARIDGIGSFLGAAGGALISAGSGFLLTYRFSSRKGT